MKIQKGDTVTVLVGKDAGKQGKVMRVLAEDSKVVVEGVNIYKRHVKGDGQNKESAIVDIVKPVHVSNVQVICPSCNKPARIGVKIEGKQKVRVCKKCGKNFEKIPEKPDSKVTETNVSEKKEGKKTRAKSTAKNSSKAEKKTESKKKTAKKSTNKSAK